MTVKGGTSQACAACKYQRRKCTADCPLAPYFPPDKPKQFQNAHRLFGVSNILKILEQLNPEQKPEAMRSIVFQADVRDRYPVTGCLEIIYRLQLQIHESQQALDAVNAQLAICRQHQLQISSPPPPVSPPSQLQLATATAPPANNVLTLFHDNHHEQQFNDMEAANTHHLFPNATAADIASSNTINENNNNNASQLWSQYSYQHSYYNNNSPSTVQSQFVAAQPISCQATVATHGYDEMSNFLDTIDDRQSYGDSKEVYDSSPESSLKDTTQSMEIKQEHVGENKLDITATCLTSVN